MKDVNLLISNGVNVKESLELFGDMETYNQTLGEFLSEVGNKLEKIKHYKETADMANYAILVHSLKSDAKYFGFTKLAELSYQHELESKANNLNFVYENYNSLMEEANKIVNLVRTYMGEKVVEYKEPVVEVKKDKAILVVDDSDIIRNFIRKIFNDTYEVIMAEDGQKAIDIIQNGDKQIVAMLLDLNMPNVDGFTVLEYFRQNNLFTKIPVSIITGEDSKNMITRACEYPIVDILSKPFNEMNVKIILEKTINFI